MTAPQGSLRASEPVVVAGFVVGAVSGVATAAVNVVDSFHTLTASQGSSVVGLVTAVAILVATVRTRQKVSPG